MMNLASIVNFTPEEVIQFKVAQAIVLRNIQHNVFIVNIRIEVVSINGQHLKVERIGQFGQANHFTVYTIELVNILTHLINIAITQFHHRLIMLLTHTGNQHSGVTRHLIQPLNPTNFKEQVPFNQEEVAINMRRCRGQRSHGSCVGISLVDY